MRSTILDKLIRSCTIIIPLLKGWLQPTQCYNTSCWLLTISYPIYTHRIILMSTCRGKKVCKYLWVANNWNPGDAFTEFPCAGTDNVRDSNSGIRMETTSIGARSMSSNNIQWPSWTACNRGPGCHTNSPGVSVQIYVPNKDYMKEN